MTRLLPLLAKMRRAASLQSRARRRNPEFRKPRRNSLAFDFHPALEARVVLSAPGDVVILPGEGDEQPPLDPDVDFDPDLPVDSVDFDPNLVDEVLEPGYAPGSDEGEGEFDPILYITSDGDDDGEGDGREYEAVPISVGVDHDGHGRPRHDRGPRAVRPLSIGRLRGKYTFPEIDPRPADAPREIGLDGRGVVQGMGLVRVRGSLYQGGFKPEGVPDSGFLVLHGRHGSVRLRLQGDFGGLDPEQSATASVSVVAGTGAYRNLRAVGDATIQLGPNEVMCPMVVGYPCPVGGRFEIAFEVFRPVR